MSLAGSMLLKRLLAFFPTLSPLAWGVGISVFLHAVVLTPKKKKNWVGRLVLGKESINLEVLSQNQN